MAGLFGSCRRKYGIVANHSFIFLLTGLSGLWVLATSTTGSIAATPSGFLAGVTPSARNPEVVAAIEPVVEVAKTHRPDKPVRRKIKLWFATIPYFRRQLPKRPAIHRGN